MAILPERTDGKDFREERNRRSFFGEADEAAGNVLAAGDLGLAALRFTGLDDEFGFSLTDPLGLFDKTDAELAFEDLSRRGTGGIDPTGFESPGVDARRQRFLDLAQQFGSQGDRGVSSQGAFGGAFGGGAPQTRQGGGALDVGRSDQIRAATAQRDAAIADATRARQQAGRATMNPLVGASLKTGNQAGLGSAIGRAAPELASQKAAEQAAIERANQEFAARRQQIGSGPAGQQGAPGGAADTFRARQAAQQEMLARLAQGHDSLAENQLRAATDRALSQQQALAAGTGNPAVQRAAQRQLGQTQAGLAGQAATAGIQERRSAQDALASALQGARGQDITQDDIRARNVLAALGGEAAAAGDAQRGGIAREQTFANLLGALSQASGQQQSGLLGGIGSVLGGILSDKTKKKNIKKADKELDALMEGLQAYQYDYKDPAFGKGRQTGIMAQDLEKSEIGKQSVVETPNGKMVSLSSLTPALAAGLARLNSRVNKLEGR